MTRSHTWESVRGEGPVYDFLKKTLHFAPGRAVPFGEVYCRFVDDLPLECRSEWSKYRFRSHLPFACPSGRIPGWKSRYGVANVAEVTPAPGDPPGRLLVHDPLDRYRLMHQGDPPRRSKKKPRRTFSVVMTVAGMPGPSGDVGMQQIAASAGGAARAAIAKIERAGGVVTSISVG